MMLLFGGAITALATGQGKIQILAIIIAAPSEEEARAELLQVARTRWGDGYSDHRVFLAEASRGQIDMVRGW